MEPIAKKSSQRSSLVAATAIVAELGLEIAIPVVLFSRLGKWADGRFGTEPKLLITGFVVAFLLSAITIWKQIKRLRDSYLDV